MKISKFNRKNIFLSSSLHPESGHSRTCCFVLIFEVLRRVAAATGHFVYCRISHLYCSFFGSRGWVPMSSSPVPEHLLISISWNLNIFQIIFETKRNQFLEPVFVDYQRVSRYGRGLLTWQRPRPLTASKTRYPSGKRTRKIDSKHTSRFLSKLLW